MIRSMLACCCFAVPALAQQTIDKSSLSGSVADTTGAGIPAATVTLTQEQSGILTTTTAGPHGRFLLPYLAPGDYSLDVTGPGFGHTLTRVQLPPGTQLNLLLTLKMGRVEARTTVNALETPIETTRTEADATVTRQEVDALPFLSRNFLDLALLVPGVSVTNTAANQLFAETSAVPGQGLSVNSQRNFSNSFLIDGLSANDDAAGLVQAAYPLDSIAALQVVTSGGQAEFGRALGGYLSFTTRAGTSHLHGTAYGFLRNQRLNAANALSGTSIPLTQAQYGASLGGPADGKTFYFGNFEQRHLNQSGVITISPENAAAINARLTATSYPGQLLAVTGPTTLYPNPVRSSNFFARADRHVSAHDDLTLRYSLYHVLSSNSRGAGALAYPSAAAGVTDLDQTLALSNVAVFSARTVNETRAQFTNSDLKAPVNDPVGPAVSISGVASFGTLSGSPTGRHDRLYEVVDNLSHQAGAHTLRVGADFVFNDLEITFPMSSRGAYAFSSLAAFQAGSYSTFTQSFGNPVVPQTNPNLGVYAQDSWAVTRSLTLNAGVRYDLDFLKSVATDTNNVSPRLGLAWVPYPSRRTVVRASYGLFYDRVPLRALSNALESNGNSTVLGPGTFTTLALNFGQAGAPAFPRINSTLVLPATARISLSTLDPHLPNASAQQASVEVEQQLSAKSSVSLSYQHLRGEHLIASVNLNTPACAAAVDPVNLCRPSPAYANNKQYTGAGDSYYDGLAVSYTQRPLAHGSYRLSYTWSKAIDDVGEFFFSSPVNNSNLREDRSRSDDDQRHRLTADATLHTSLEHSRKLLGGLQLGGILQYTSRLPFNIVTGTNSIQTTALRPCLTGPAAGCASAAPGTLIGRNAGRGFAFYTLNTRLTKTFWIGERVHLDAIAEAFNSLNHRNDQIPNTTFGTGAFNAGSTNGAFGQATAVGDSRQVQLALRLNF